MKKDRTIYLNPEGLGEKDKDYFISKGYESRYDWYRKTIHNIKGATLRQNVVTEIDKEHVKTENGNGTTDYPKPKNPKPRNKNIKYIPPRKDIEDIFEFNYNDMLLCEPNEEYNKVKSLVFNHKFYNYDNQLWYYRMIDKYNELTNEELEKINIIYQKLSRYINENNLSRKWVDGCVIVNIALIVDKYLKTGEYCTNMDFFNSIETNDCLDEDIQFHLFLITQCFISKNRYYHKYVAGIPTTNWWAIVKLHHRRTDKDMKSKGKINNFKDENGKNICMYK